MFPNLLREHFTTLYQEDGKVLKSLLKYDLQNNKGKGRLSLPVHQGLSSEGYRIRRAAYNCYPLVKVVIACIPFQSSGRKRWPRAASIFNRGHECCIAEECMPYNHKVMGSTPSRLSA